MASERSERELVCVLFPGIVKNDNNALKCLGGIHSISEANSETNVRLSLSFQPDNPYVKGTYANTKKSAGVLLKVKVKKTKVNGSVECKALSTSIVGRVSKVFKFDAMCDFQYLPMQHFEGQNKNECLLEQILPTKLTTPDFLSETAPLYLPPPAFLRMDKPFSYNYSERTLFNRHTKEREEYRKAMLVSNVLFNLEDEFPTEPNKLVYNSTQAKFKLMSELPESDAIVKKALEERPIWTLSAIANRTRLRPALLRLVLLPCRAFFMFDGPWKKCWVRFGYDPRQEPAARFFQVLDFRVRSSGGVSSIISRRGVPYSVTNNVVFRPGCVLTQRQVYYQYCDIKLPEVEELLARKPGAGELCHARRGWLAPGAHDAARDLVFTYAKEAALAAHSGTDFKFERGSSGDSESEPDDAADDDANT